MLNRSSLFDEAPGTAVTTPVAWWVITDAVSAAVVPLMREKTLKHPEKVKVFIDHDTPCGSVAVAAEQKALIRFAEENGCELFNGSGISHHIMLDRFVNRGDVVAGCFSHGAIYGAAGGHGVSLPPEALAESLQRGETTVVIPKTTRIRLEGSLAPPASVKDAALCLRARRKDEIAGARVLFSGPGAEAMTVAQRATLCHLSGAAFAGFEIAADSSPDCSIDLAAVRPVVAGPHTLDILAPASAFSGKAVNEVFIGGCSGGGIEDLRLAASILAGKRVPPRVRLMVAPATTEVYRRAADEGILETFLDAGAIVMNQGCSVCWGKSQGIVDDREVLLSAGSRNHKGCAGSEAAEVYLCSASVAAHSALAGTITEGGR